MAAWFEFFRLVGYIKIVQVLIGVAAVVVGLIHLRDFFTKKADECKVTEGEMSRRSKFMQKIKALAQPRNLPATLGGVIALAFAVNLIELFCSAGFPAIYTGILSASDLATWKYFAYILLYIFFFMLDDLVVFIIAILTMNAVGLKGKYARYSNFIGGLLIIILGLIMLIRPELLQFG